MYITSGTIKSGVVEYSAIMTTAVMPRTNAMGSPEQMRMPNTMKKESVMAGSLALRVVG